MHGNLPALEAALEALAGGDRLAFLGDYLGRGDSDRCVRLIRSVADVAVLGNRDLDWRDRVGAETRAWVESLPRSACVDGMLLAHGDERLVRHLGTGQIRREFREAWAQLEQSGATLLAFGHSHHARAWRKASADQPAEFIAEAEFRLRPAWRYFLNVGSTGLPFPGKGGPSVAVVDLGEQRVRRVSLAQAASGPE